MRYLFTLILAAGCSTNKGSLSSQEKNSKDTVKIPAKTFTGIQVRGELTKFNPPLAHGIQSGIVIETVIPHSSGWKAGLRPNDIILEENDIKKFLEKLNYSSPEEKIKLKILSQQKIKTLLLTPEIKPYSYGKIYPQTPITYSLVPDESFVLEKQLQSSIDPDLLKKFQTISQKGDLLRPFPIRYLQKNPLSIHEASQNALKALRNCRNVSCISEITTSKTKKIPHVKPPQKTIKDHLRYIEKVLTQAQLINDAAFNKLSLSEKTYLKNNIDEISNRFIENLYLHEDVFSGRKKRFYQLTEILEKVELSKFQESLIFLSQHLDQKYLQSLSKLLKNHKKFPITSNTPYGVIYIAGPEHNDHSDIANENTALIVDLGGDDLYSDNKGNILDLSGNDRYESSVEWTLAGAKLSSRILLDLSGDDVYNCQMQCLGSSFLGSSLFADYSGHDTYFSQIYTQGSSFAGTSFFIDNSGNDSYSSFGLSQSVAVAGGTSFFIDNAGNDTYKSHGFRPSAYGDPGQNESWSQGVAIGLRYFLSGGIAVLYDRSGKDTFEAGTFSQGGGYYYGWGILLNDGLENDTYKSMRYSQGFSAHQAIGTFVEVGGDDIYLVPPPVVSTGIAWDLGISYFEDQKGNDTYTAGDKSLGSASQSSFAFFFERSGNDIYTNSSVVSLTPNPNDYHGGLSLGYFLDSSQGNDSYLNFKNNSCQKTEGVSIICDE